MSEFSESNWACKRIISELAASASGAPVSRGEDEDEEQYTCSGRGGSSLCAVDDYVLMFGGVTRDQYHFADLWVVDKSSLDALLATGSSSSRAVRRVSQNSLLFVRTTSIAPYCTNSLYVCPAY